jgi:hypothetical protein
MTTIDERLDQVKTRIVTAALYKLEGLAAEQVDRLVRKGTISEISRAPLEHALCCVCLAELLVGYAWSRTDDTDEAKGVLRSVVETILEHPEIREVTPKAYLSGVVDRAKAKILQIRN